MSRKRLIDRIPDYKFLGSSTKGLSDVVTTLIIILISLVAIGVVWVVVQNVIQGGSEQVDLGDFTLDLQIKSVQVEDENVTVVVVKRNPGQGEFVGMDFIFSDGQNSEIIRKNVSLNVYDTKSFTFELTRVNASNIKTVSVAPVYLLNSGKETTGNLADSFDIPANKSLGTEQNSGTGTGQAISKFEAHGFVGAGTTEYDIENVPGGTSPSFSSVTIDPLDVHLGQLQTFTAHVSSPYNVTNVTTITELDNQTLYLDLILQQDGSWSASWQVYDTHLATYTTTFIATDGAGNVNNMTLTWTDPTSCSTFVTQGQASTITADCALSASEINGLDAGILTIGSGATVTLNSGSNLVYTDGFSLVKASGARIVKSGGSIRKGYIYFHGSGTTATNATPVFGTYFVPPSGFIRVKNATAISNCNTVNAISPKSSPGSCAAFCTDSDGGIDHFLAGTATAYDGSCTNSGCSISAQSADYCVDTIKLGEVYCSGNQIYSDGNVHCQDLYAADCIDATCGGP